MSIITIRREKAMKHIHNITQEKGSKRASTRRGRKSQNKCAPSSRASWKELTAVLINLQPGWEMYSCHESLLGKPIWWPLFLPLKSIACFTFIRVGIDTWKVWHGALCCYLIERIRSVIQFVERKKNMSWRWCVPWVQAGKPDSTSTARRINTRALQESLPGFY